MLKSEPGDFNPLAAISRQLIYSIVQKPIAPIGLSVVLGLASVSWLTTAVIAPQSVQAYTARVDVSLSRELEESYESFLRRAEAVARAAAQRSFDGDILVTDVRVMVLGQNDGAIAPVLLLEVSRQDWRSRPDPQQWATYLPDAPALLGFEGIPGQAEPQPQAVPQQVPPPPMSAPQGIETPGTPIPVQGVPSAPPTIPQQTEIPTPTATPAPENPGIPTNTTPLPPAPSEVPTRPTS
ncbi:MAG TPA: hypothetical protein V6C95_21255 [Coleofasciculaceae cyanobacterium]